MAIYSSILAREIPWTEEPGGYSPQCHKQSGTTEQACSVASVMSDSLRPLGLKPTRLLCPWDFPGKNTGLGCHALPQGIFPTQGLNSHCRWILSPLSHLGSQQEQSIRNYKDCFLTQAGGR